MRAIMLGYWIILVGVVLDIVGTIWDILEPVTGENAAGGATYPRNTEIHRNSHSNTGPSPRV